MKCFNGEGIQVSITDTAVRIGEKYSIDLKLSWDYGFVDEAKVIMNQQKSSNQREIKMDFIETKDNMNLFSCNVDFENVGLHYFCFKLVINGITKWIKFDEKHMQAMFAERTMPYWSITVYENDFHVPEWAKGKIMYQIFPDRFFKSDEYVPQMIETRVTKKWGDIPNWELDKEGIVNNNDYFMGNIKGIEEKLEYLKELGVEIIYLNPIWKSQSNHRYDTADYEVVDDYLGRNEDLKNLCDVAHNMGIHIVIDAVFNHTGSDSKYFNEFGNYDTIGASQSEQSPYYKWFRKNDEGQFEYWWGFKNLPVCDGNNPEWQNYVYGENGVIDKWFSLGIDGIRLDVADELTDQFIENIRKAVKRNKPDGLIIGEVWDNAVTKEGYGKQRTYLLGKGLDTVMNYPLTNAILKYVRFGKDEFFTETLNEILMNYPEEAVFSLMNSISTHDITRAMTTLVGDGIQKNEYNWVWDVPYSRRWQYTHNKLDEERYEKAKQMLKVSAVIQYFLPGSPCIYYGDEVGMYGYKDPFCRYCFPWENIDEELHSFFVTLGKTRKMCNFLRDAKTNIININSNILTFERTSNTDKVLIIVNRSEDDQKVNLPEDYKNCETILSVNCNEDIISKYGILIKKV